MIPVIIFIVYLRNCLITPVQPNYSCQQGQVIDSEIQNLLNKGVIVESTHESNEYISPIFLRPKKDGSHRLIYLVTSGWFPNVKLSIGWTTLDRAERTVFNVL